MSAYNFNPLLLQELEQIQEREPHASKILSQQHISTNDLIYLYTKHWASVPIARFLTGGIYIDRKAYGLPIKPSYTPEFQAELDSLKYSLEEQEYQQMVNKGVSVSEDELTPAQMNKIIREQITTVFNILISVGSVVYAVWYWTRHTWSLPHRVLLCMFFAVLILVAEVVVYNSYLNKIQDAKDRERRKKDKTSVVESLVFKKEK